MNIYNNYLFLNKNTPNNNDKARCNFCGNITKTVGELHLKGQELTQATDISNYYKHLWLLYKGAGNFIGDLLRKMIPFLMPASVAGFILKDTIKSTDNEDIKIEPTAGKSEDFLTLTISKKGNNDIAKITVSKTRPATITADEDLSKAELTKYLDEINKNHNRLFETVLEKTKTVMNSVDSILKEEYGDDVDLSSPEQLKTALKRFIDERKRVTVLTQLINKAKFIPRFTAETGATISHEGQIADKYISFSFLSVENQYFSGMNLAVTDNKNKIVQGFVAMDDGYVYKTPAFKLGEHMPHDVWTRNLTALAEEELKSPELNYMFNYAFKNTDLVSKYMLDEFYKGNHPRTDLLDKLTEKANIPPKQAEEKPFAEERAKVVKTYSISPKLVENITKIDNLRTRISKAYNAGFRQRETAEVIEQNSGLLRKRNVSDFIVKDIKLPGGLSLGISRYNFLSKDTELLSFDIYDENLKQIARYKVMQNGEARLFVKLNANGEFIRDIRKLANSAFNEELTQQILPILEDACYYHENYYKIKIYMERSYYPITLQQAIKELQAPITPYLLDETKTKNLKDCLENISSIYKKYPAIEYYYKNDSFQNFPSKSRIYVKNRIDEQDINYEAIAIDRKTASGVRILTRDNNGNNTNCYIISDNGEVYKLLSIPQNNDFHFDMQKSNFSVLDENAVKTEHLDLIFENLYDITLAYSKFLEECVEKHKSQPLELPKKDKMSQNGETDVVKRRPGRPRKNPVDTAPKPAAKRGRLKKESADTAETPVSTEPKRRGRLPRDPEKKPANSTATHTPKPTVKPVNPKIKTAKEKPAERASKKPAAKTAPQITVQGEQKMSQISPASKNTTVHKTPLDNINFSNVVKRFEEIVKTSYQYRSPHLVHEETKKGVVSPIRFSATAPDGAELTVTRVLTGMSFYYYSIRVQKGNDVMYLNINPKTGRILQNDENNNIMRGDSGEFITISKEHFADENPLCKNMPMYLEELFAQKPEATRTIIPWRNLKIKDLEAQKAKRAAERAEEIRALEELAQKAEEAEL